MVSGSSYCCVSSEGRRVTFQFDGGNAFLGTVNRQNRKPKRCERVSSFFIKGSYICIYSVDGQAVCSCNFSKGFLRSLDFPCSLIFGSIIRLPSNHFLYRHPSRSRGYGKL